jgi:ribonuclease R
VSVVNGYTIDGSRSRDLDDAIWVSPTDSGWVVTVSIADVAGAVAIGSEDDELARTMTATKYFGTGNSPMLRRWLSENELSLLPNRTRSVFVVEITLDVELNTVSTDLRLEEIRSKQKLAYINVPKILADKEHRLHAQISTAAALAQRLLAKRRAAGAMALYDLNNGWVTTEEGHLRQLEDHSETIGQVIVQEFMVLANKSVSVFAITRDVPILFRNHTARSAAPDRAELLRQLDEAVRLPVANLDVLRSRTHLLLDRANYGADVRGHYGLNLAAYTHFTSPIRRYADLVTHRQVRAAVLGESLPYTREQVALIGAHINDTLEQERESQSEYMKRKCEHRVSHEIEARRIDGLDAKDFERATKLEARSGNDPSEAFADAFIRRVREKRAPLIALTVVLTQAPHTQAWKPLGEAIVAYLQIAPEAAVSMLWQASQIVEGWPVVVFEAVESGGQQPVTFTARATLTRNAETTVAGEATAGQRKRAEQLAAVVLIARYFGVELNLANETAEPPSQKNPVSVLYEWCQKRGLAAPRYEFETSGPPHAPVITCCCKANDHVGSGTAKNKQEAKRIATSALISQLLATKGTV